MSTAHKADWKPVWCSPKINLYPFLKIEIKLTYHKIHPFQVYSSGVFSITSVAHHCYIILEHSPHPQNHHLVHEAVTPPASDHLCLHGLAYPGHLM